MGQCIVSRHLQFSAFMTLTFGVDYHSYSSQNSFSCPSAATNDVCILHCDEIKTNVYSFDCGNTGYCIFQCEQRQCLENGILNATNITYDLTVLSSGSQCLKGSIINLPNTGNASFSMTKEKSFKGMTVNAGTNTQQIHIDCTYGVGDECKEMNVNGASAQYLEITVGASSEYKGDEKKMIAAQINCPQKSNYYPLPSCIIDLSDGGLLQYVDINTLNGIPMDLLIKTGVDTVIIDVNITCDDGWYLNGGNNVSSPSNPCWNEEQEQIVLLTTTTSMNESVSTQSVATTESINKYDIEYEYEYDLVSSSYLILVIIIILSIIFVITLIVCIQKKMPENQCCLRLFNPADDCRIFALIIFALQFWDFISDINLSYAIYHRYQYYNSIDSVSSISNHYNHSLFQYVYLSAIFVIVPWITNLIFLVFMRKEWAINGRVSCWLRDYVVFLVILTMASGGANAAIQVCNCRIFGYTIFEMGLPKRMIVRTSRYRVILVTVMENIPQLCIQMLYVTLTKKWEMAVIIASISSSLTIVLTLSTVLVQCYDKMEDKVVEIRVLPSSEDIKNVFHLKKMTHLRSKTATGIARSCSMDPRVVEVENIFMGHSSLRIIVAINTMLDHLTILHSFQTIKDDGSLAESIKNAMRLKHIPAIQSVQVFMTDELISNIDQQIESRRKSTIDNQTLSVRADKMRANSASYGGSDIAIYDPYASHSDLNGYNNNNNSNNKNIDSHSYKIKSPKEKKRKNKKQDGDNNEDEDVSPIGYNMNALELTEIQSAFDVKV